MKPQCGYYWYNLRLISLMVLSLSDVISNSVTQNNHELMSFINPKLKLKVRVHKFTND